MKEILLTSSVLILALLLLRLLFRKTISRRMQYALWGLVLLRLLIPVNMLRHGETVFLDDLSVADVEEALHVKVVQVPQDGAELLFAMLGEETD